MTCRQSESGRSAAQAIRNWRGVLEDLCIDVFASNFCVSAVFVNQTSGASSAVVARNIRKLCTQNYYLRRGGLSPSAVLVIFRAAGCWDPSARGAHRDRISLNILNSIPS